MTLIVSTHRLALLIAKVVARLATEDLGASLDAMLIEVI